MKFGEIAFFSIIPLFTVLFAYGFLQQIWTQREHSFDSSVLLVSFIINVILITQELICDQLFSVAYLNFSIGVIAYIMFEVVKDHKGHSTRHRHIFWALSGFGVLIALATTASGFIGKHTGLQLQILMMKCVEFVLGSCVVY